MLEFVAPDPFLMAKIAAPKPPLEPHPPRQDWASEPCVWQEGAHWNDAQLSSAAFELLRRGGSEISRLNIERCEFDAARLAQLEWSKLDASDVVLRGCDLSNAVWPNAQVFRARLEACRATGLRANESRWQHIVWRECLLSLAQFRFAEFKSTRFENCLLRGSDFESADLRGVVFERCDLSQARFERAQLSGADIRGCTIEGLHMDAPSLRGLVIDPAQAIHFVGLLGARIAGVGEAL